MRVQCTEQGVFCELVTLSKTPTRVLLQNIFYFSVHIGANK